MAVCKVRTVKMDAIYNLVKNLLADPDNNINTPTEVLEWFEKKYGNKISKEEIIDSFVVLDQKNIDDSKKQLNDKMKSMRTWARQSNRLGLFLENALQRNVGKKSKDSPETEQVKEAFNQFQEAAKKGKVTDDDIDLLTDMIQSLPLAGNYDRAGIESVVNQLIGLRKQKQEQRDSKRVERISGQLGKLFKGEVKRVAKTKVPDEAHLQELRNIMNELRRYARSDREITSSQASDIMSRLAEIEQQYLEHYDTDGDVSEDAIRKAIENYREIRNEMQIDSLQKRLTETKRRIDALNDPDSPDYASIVTDNTGIPWKGKAKEIVLLEAELEDAQEKLLAMKESILRKAKARSITRIMGLEKLWGISVQGKGVQGMIRFYYAAKQHGWELLRTLKFMFDNSAFFVQLAPIVTIDMVRTLSGYDFAKYALGKETDPFAGLNRARFVLMEGFLKVVQSDWNESKKHPLLSKTARGSYVVKLHNDIVEHHLYDLMHESGLRISRSRSLSDSEEYFKTNILNKVPGFGFVKDISEDVMVSTLNLYRVMLFEKFYEMHPNLSAEEYGKAAEGINNLTGTTKLFGQVLGPAALVLSAPRLLAAKIKIALNHPWKVITALDIPGSIDERRLKYNSAYNAFMVRQMAGIWASFGFIGLVAGLAGMAVGTDPEDKDFMRIRHGKRSYDITGGLGAIYRTLALMWYLTTGPSKNASYKAKERINYLRSVKKWDLIWAILGFERTKFHPAISTMAGVATGKDFIGRPYAKTELGSRLEALGRGFLPIFIESFIFDDAIPEINNPEEWLPSFADAILQFHGINVFEYDSDMQDLKVEQFINKLNYQPDIRYPEELKERNGKKLKEGLAKEYLMQKYKNMWGDALGKLILENPDISKEDLKSKWNNEKGKVQDEFMKKYKDDIKKLQTE